jgi:hypothetical protein
MGASVWAGAHIGAAMAGFSFGGMLAGLSGGILTTALSLGAQYLMGQTKKPRAEEISTIVKSSAPIRAMLIGGLLVGGSLVFSGVKEGAVHYALHHGDSECVETIDHWFIDQKLTLGTEAGWPTPASNFVKTEDFTIKGAAYFQVEPHDGTLDQTVSPILNADYPEWDATHRGIGCAYTVVKGWPIQRIDRDKVYKHQGPLGLGEPPYMREARWGRVYDPRKDSTRELAPGVFGSGSHRVDDYSTWGYDNNAALVLAMFRVHRDGWAKPLESVNWKMIAAQADICDDLIIGRGGFTVRRYTINTAIPFNEPRMAAEKRMLEACDGMRFFDEDGKWFVRVGAYYEPTVTLRARDISRIKIVPNADGESEHNAYITEYTDPRLNYATQPSAPWYHPDHYEEGVTNTITATLQTPEIDNPNQATRICKAVGTRSRAKVRMEIIAGWRGLRLKKHRFVSIDLDDAVVDGDYEIMGREEMADGMHVHMVLVKTDPGNWDLLPGEEGPLPTYDDISSSGGDLPAVTSLSVYAEPVAVSGGFAVRLAADFDPPENPSHQVVVEYKKNSDSQWLEMTSVTDQGRAYSTIVEDGEAYRVRAYVESSGGRTGAYTPDASGALVNAVADTVAPGALTSVIATGGSVQLGTVALTIATPADPQIKRIAIYRVPAGGSLNRGAHLLGRIWSPLIGAIFDWLHGDATRTGMLADPDFDDPGAWQTVNGWSISAGIASKTPGAAGIVRQAGLAIASGSVIRASVMSTGTGMLRLRLDLGGAGLDDASDQAAPGRLLWRLPASDARERAGFRADAAFDGAIEDAPAYIETPTCATQGIWDIHVIPENGSGIEGPPTVLTGLVTV